MDSEKSIEKSVGALSPFFDENPVRTNPFGNNSSAERLYRRAERVVGAIHLLTNHIDTKEPTRISVRATGLDILGSALTLRDGLRAEGSPALDAFRASVRYSISLVRMLMISGFVSVQNAQTMMEALDELGNFAKVSQRSPLSEGVVLTRHDLLDIGQSVRLKDTGDIKDKAIVKDMRDVSITDTSADHTVRKEGIMEVLRSRGALGIRDIASNLPEYSEKMVQRSLASLVSEGRVKKLGSKRWSRYLIASS